MRWSRVPACCQTAAVTKLCVHRGCQPGCLNTSSLVYSPRRGGDKGKKPSKERAPSILDSVQLWIRIERQRAAGLDCKLLFLVNSVASAGPHVMRFPLGRLLGVSVIFSSMRESLTMMHFHRRKKKLPGMDEFAEIPFARRKDRFSRMHIYWFIITKSPVL